MLIYMLKIHIHELFLRTLGDLVSNYQLCVKMSWLGVSSTFNPIKPNVSSGGTHE